MKDVQAVDYFYSEVKMTSKSSLLNFRQIWPQLTVERPSRLSLLFVSTFQLIHIIQHVRPHEEASCSTDY